MTIVTGFMGMSQDQEGYVRPQIGWSIHCYKTCKDVKEQSEIKKRASLSNYPFNQIDKLSKSYIL